MADSVESNNDDDSLQNDALSIYEQQNISMFRLVNLTFTLHNAPYNTDNFIISHTLHYSRS